MDDRRSLFMAGLITLGVGVGVGWVLSLPEEQNEPGADAEEPLYWVAPMDSEFRSDEPGLSPMGMDLVPVYAADLAGDEGAGVRISPDVQSNLGIRTAEAVRGTLSRQVQTVGLVQYDEESMGHVRTRVDGWIEAQNVDAVGDSIDAGQVLFELYSPTLVSAQQELLAALASGSRNLIRASRERLNALGMSAEQIEKVERNRAVDRTVTVRADRSGVISELDVREGQYITPSSDTMIIASLEEVWVLGEVLERQSGWVAEGQTVDLRFDAFPGETWSGRLDRIYPELHQATRTVQVRVRIPNPDHRLRPNMFVRLVIHGAPTEPTVHVPSEAVIRSGRGDRVVLETEDGRFAATPVTVGIESGERVQILAGLDAGDRVIVSGQFLIDSESSLTAESHRAGGRENGTSDPAAVQDERFSGIGTVQGWSDDRERLQVRHGPIEALGWPEMSMAFDLADPALAHSVEVGDEIRFILVEHGQGFRITELSVIRSERSPGTAGDGDGHDAQRGPGT